MSVPSIESARGAAPAEAQGHNENIVDKTLSQDIHVHLNGVYGDVTLKAETHVRQHGVGERHLAKHYEIVGTALNGKFFSLDLHAKENNFIV